MIDAIALSHPPRSTDAITAPSPEWFEKPKILLPGEKLEGHGILIINDSDVPLTIYAFGPPDPGPYYYDWQPSIVYQSIDDERCGVGHYMDKGGIIKFYRLDAPNRFGLNYFFTFISEKELAEIEEKKKPKTSSSLLLKQLGSRA